MRNVFRSISAISPPPAILRNMRSEAFGSWLASSPARSEDSSLLRNHSSRASWIGSSAMPARDRKSTRLNSSHGYISYAVFCLKKKKKKQRDNMKTEEMSDN